MTANGNDPISNGKKQGSSGASCHRPVPPGAIAVCEGCGEGIEVGDTYYEYDGDLYHEECFEDAALSILIGEGAALREASAEDVGDGGDGEYERRRERWLLP